MQDTNRHFLAEQIRKGLLKKGINIRRWSAEKGFDYGYVLKLIGRYAGKPTIPRSPLSYKILTALYVDTGIDLMGWSFGNESKND